MVSLVNKNKSNLWFHWSVKTNRRTLGQHWPIKKIEVVNKILELHRYYRY